ncbi:MAG: TetR/AcrR family transcriptional regulator [Chloroflexi bacterium]|nr:TetR/AcrR family transcriptional regulator [Chloroflexota bacterium]MDA8187906.1 TetR/AcrR family transcriptional regulator [Dehalococcoidales bacterium]
MDKESIIAAAVQLFRTKGYHATTVREIADRLGVTSAALYYHVSSKEQILCEIFDKAMTAAERRLDRLMSLDVPTDKRLELIIHEHVMATLDEAPLMAVFFNDVEHLPSDSYQAAVERKKKYQDRIVEVFKEAIAQGILQDIDPELAVFGILGMCNWMHHWYRPDGRKSPDDVAQLFANMVLQGIRTQGSPRH